MTRTVAILVFDGVEPLDVVGPFETFISDEDSDDVPAFEVALVSQTGAPATAAGGFVMTPRWSFADMPLADILLVPGGWGTRTLSKDRDMLDWIIEQDRRSELTLSVCTGAQMLAAAGLLKGLKATTYWSTYDELREIDPTVEVMEGARWVDNGRIVCSSGVSAGIDMALHVISRLHGAERAAKAARAMEYEYWPPRDAA